MARELGLEEEIAELTRETVRGNVPFVESFIRRVDLLGQQSAEQISELLSGVALFQGICDFIEAHAERCIIATGNLDVWTKGLLARLPCEFVTSLAELHDDRVTGIRRLFLKEELVAELQAAGETVVFIGDGNNDAEAMRLADYSIASGLVHDPAASVMAVADWAVFDERALIRLLKALAAGGEDEGQTLVLSCAGIGSRLGLRSSKALIRFHDRALIAWQLEHFACVEDMRIVVGFQTNEVIVEALRHRSDLIFVLNHDYLSTGTGQSLYLGSRFARQYVLAWRGDLIVHHADLPACLNAAGEYLGFNEANADDAIHIETYAGGELATCISREDQSSAEWSGPLRLKRDRIRNSPEPLLQSIEAALPLAVLRIRAFGIDTPADFAYANAHFRDYLRIEP